MVAVSPHEDLDDAITGGDMTKAGLKLMDS
jgi:hypothetical protein